ncbi:MAG TPA: hypothetical protein VK502_01690 [Candidatus Saccharimonadales bacterium]|nr:hypothetical protein [Candidatus Saccharimonadales bacterium]
MRKPAFSLSRRGSDKLSTEFLPSPKKVMDRITALAESAKLNQSGSKKARAPKPVLIGRADITVDLSEIPVTICFDLQKRILEEDWSDWEEILKSVEGVTGADRADDYQVTLRIGNYFKHPRKAREVANQAAKALLLGHGAIKTKDVKSKED